MKKYIKPTTVWTKMDNEVLMAGSDPGISEEPAKEPEACSKENKNFSLWDVNDGEFDDEYDY